MPGREELLRLRHPASLTGHKHSASVLDIGTVPHVEQDTKARTNVQSQLRSRELGPLRECPTHTRIEIGALEIKVTTVKEVCRRVDLTGQPNMLSWRTPRTHPPMRQKRSEAQRHSKTKLKTPYITPESR